MSKPNKILFSIYPVIKPFWIPVMDARNMKRVKSLRDDLSEVFARYSDTKLSYTSQIPRTVWSLWYSDDNKPELCRLCLKRMEDSLVPLGYDVNILTKDTIGDFIDMSDILPYLEEGKITIQFYSDIIRTRLLREYGGFWLDATMAVLDPEELDRMRESVPFISFRTTPRPYTHNITKNLYNSFFLGSWEGNPLFQFIDEGLTVYLIKHGGNSEYFFWHYLVRAGYEYIPFVKEEIDGISSYYPGQVNQLWLRKVLEMPYDEGVYQEILRNAPLQKQNYKEYDKDGPLKVRDGKETFYGHLLSVWS